MTQKKLTDAQIHQRGLEALQEALGLEDMIKFFTLHASGKGDYTKERRAWTKTQTLDQIVRRIRRREAKKTKSAAVSKTAR